MKVIGNDKSVEAGRVDVVALSDSIENTIGRMLNDAGVELNLIPLEWRLVADGAIEFEGQHPGGRGDAGAVTACKNWALALGLREPDFSSSDSYRMWSGDVGDWAVSLFAVSDEALYQAEFPEDSPRSAAPGAGMSAG